MSLHESDGGAYTAERASALAGVPKSTVHYWARNGIIAPSVSDDPRIWSYGDLLKLRLVYWLRQPKQIGDTTVRATQMPEVIRALSKLEELELDLFDADGHPRVCLAETGEIQIFDDQGWRAAGGQLPFDFVDLLDPFEAISGFQGPDLRRPRPDLRIAPRKLSGAPHLRHTRLETAAIAALSRRGFSFEALHELYPFATTRALRQAVDLEDQLLTNEAKAAKAA